MCARFTPEEFQDREQSEALLGEIYEECGLAPAVFESEEAAPEVDLALLEREVRGQVNLDEHVSAWMNITRFYSWFRGYYTAVIDVVSHEGRLPKVDEAYRQVLERPWELFPEARRYRNAIILTLVRHAAERYGENNTD